VYATLLADGTGSGTKDYLWCGLAYDGPCDVVSGLTTVQILNCAPRPKPALDGKAVIRSSRPNDASAPEAVMALGGSRKSM
jgi:hypothetical protein